MYEYKKLRAQTLTDDGQKILLKLWGKILQDQYRVIPMTDMWEMGPGDLSAYVDRLLELGLLREVSKEDAELYRREFVVND